MTEQDLAQLRITVESPGFEILERMAHSRIEQAKYEAFMNTDEKKVLDTWRLARAASQILELFTDDVRKAVSQTGGIAQQEKK